jgi:hypothetical protein
MAAWQAYIDKTLIGAGVASKVRVHQFFVLQARQAAGPSM